MRSVSSLNVQDVYDMMIQGLVEGGSKRDIPFLKALFSEEVELRSVHCAECGVVAEAEIITRVVYARWVDETLEVNGITGMECESDIVRNCYSGGHPLETSLSSCVTKPPMVLVLKVKKEAEDMRRATRSIEYTLK